MLFKKDRGFIAKPNKVIYRLFRIIACSIVFIVIAAFHRHFAPGVVAELKFSEGAGTTTADASGNSHNGTLVNGPVWTAGKYGQGINFDGSNDYLNIADHNNFTLDPTQSYTWSAWVKNNNFNQWGTVWSQTVNSSNFFYFYAHTTTDGDGGPVTNGVSVYWINGSNKLCAHSTNNTLTVGQWSYIAISYDASQPQNNRFTIYVNGLDVTARNDIASTGTITTLNPTNIRAGSNQPFGEYLNGAVDEVRYYRRLLSLAEIQSDMNIGNAPDTQLPTVNITAPAAGNVSGTIDVSANASDNVGVAGVQFLLDGVNLGAEDVSAPYSTSWNTTTVANGSHNLEARARDAAGNTTNSTVIAVNVNNIQDVQAPTVNITSPGGGTVTGNINVTANAADDIGVVGVQFLLNGANLGAEDLSAPYSVSWNTIASTNGNYVLTARARDASGKSTVSLPVNVTVSNSNLVAAYGFNENTGTSTTDNSGNGNTGTLINGPAWSASGRFGAAIVFDGTNDYININDANSLDLTNGMTVEAWVNPSNLTGFKTVVCKDRTTSNFTYTIAANNNTSGTANQRPNARIRIGNNNITSTGTTKLTLNTWTHIACTYDGANLRYFVNGVQVSSVATSGNITVTTDPLRIGGSTALSAQYFAGLIDEVRIYNRALSQAEIQTDMNTPIAPDVTNPTVNITSPAAGNVSGTINIAANASDNIAVTGVQFLVNGSNFGTEHVTAPYTIPWNTTTVANGEYILAARARDAAGNTTTSTQITVTVNNDTEQPNVTISEPAAGDVAGTIDIKADASDNVGIVGVQFLLNGANLGAEDQTAPYSTTWNTTTVADGNYTLTAVARDAAGNLKSSSPVVVNVLNHPPDTEFPLVNITLPAPGDVVGDVNITADASDNVGIVGVQFLLNGANLGAEDQSAPYSVQWNTEDIPNGNYTLTARARDAAGNLTTSASVVVNVNNPVDTQDPTVSLTSPAAGNISGTINIQATASDNTGVVGVQFQLDGVDLGAEDISAPYSLQWNSTSVGNGPHSLVAIARDAAGNEGISAEVIINVNNDITPPSVSIIAPTGGTVTGTINVTANASDNIGVAGVQFLLDGNALGAEDVSAPYSISWNTALSANGPHALSARVRDAAGNTNISSVINVTVSNISNIIAALAMNENTGVSAADNSGNNHHGTLTGGPLWNPGKYGQGVLFDGSNDYINVADHNNFTLNPTQNYTWSAWVKNNNFTQWSTVWSQTINSTNFFYFYAHTTNDPDGGPVTNGVSVYWWGGSNRLGAHSSNNVLTAGQWSHITVTYDASQPQNNRFSIYVNGVDVTVRNDVSSAGTIATINPTNIRLGSNQPFGEYFNGSIDEFRFYNRLLTAAEVVNDMNTPIGIDNTAPTVSISSPAAGNVSGTINITANASDNVNVAGVQFLLDGIALGPEDLTAPYELAWNTETVSNGDHVLTAQARDAAGNITTSAAVNVTVAPNFSFVATTPVKNVEESGTTDFRFYVTYQNGFTSSSVSLSVSGVPPTATTHYLLNPMSHQGETQLFVTTNNTPPGTYILTASATAEGITKTQQITMNVTGAADFSLQASPAIQNVPRGNATTFTINLNETNDFINPVQLSVLGLPAGVTATFNPASPVPATTSILTLSTSPTAEAGTYNLTVQGVSGSIVRTIPVTLTITTAQSVWTVVTMGSTGVPNNTVRVGHLKADGLERIYVGTIATGRMLEYSWNGTGWNGPIDVGGSPSGQEIHNCTIGPGRGDGKERMYIASYDFNIYEIWHDETGWHQMTVGNVGSNLGMHTVVGVGRNDGVTRLYAASTQQLFEFTWNGTSWTKLLIGSTPGAHELALGDGRRDGNNYIYISSISSGNFEARWTGTAWVIASMGDNGDARGLELGDGRNDGITRIYAAMYNGTVREFTWNGTAWTFVNMPLAGTQNVHAYIVTGRNDGINRVYTCNANGKVFEYSWTGTGWEIYNMGGGSDYMYGLHYGTGRNDGIIRFYGADRGSVNRVYEFTWQAPNPLVKFRNDNGRNYSMKRRLY